MKLAIVTVFALLASLAAGPPAASAQSLLLDYVGFDYEDPDPDSTTFGEVGSGYVGLGFMVESYAPLTPDTLNNEYTYVISGLTSVSVLPIGDFIIITYSEPGNLSVYEDSKTTGTPADYGTNPPNATAPSTFNDGGLFLSGRLDNFTFIYNTVNNTGSYEADFEADGGSQLANIPANQRTGWTFAGATGNALSIPEGYEHQIDGQIFLNEPVPVENSSWGGIKAKYRP